MEWNSGKLSFLHSLKASGFLLVFCCAWTTSVQTELGQTVASLMSKSAMSISNSSSSQRNRHIAIGIVTQIWKLHVFFEVGQLLNFLICHGNNCKLPLTVCISLSNFSMILHCFCAEHSLMGHHHEQALADLHVCCNLSGCLRCVWTFLHQA